ncbi:MAG: hypothetical protein E6K88_01365 [Thaumarchaeota archaeon]|nr:MAG: hypothetical protein E6K88_01365 [Nitrososphaerota archaeon]
MAVIVNCAGDNELANKLYDYLGSEFSPTPADLISLKEDEITIKHTELGIKNDAVRKSLNKFVESSPDLGGYSITEFGDIFTVGIPQSLDKVILSCEMCGYLAPHEDELSIHKRTHGLLFIP